MHQFKDLVKAEFHEHCKSVLYTLMFDLLDHVVEDVEKFGNLEPLGETQFKSFTMHIKQSYTKTSQRQKSGSLETVRVRDEPKEDALTMNYRRDN